jgi:hypothetical protein
MKISINNILNISISFLLLAAISIPQQTMGQRFNHGGGGAARPAPAQVSRPSINGGSRNMGNHVFNRPSVSVAPRPNVTVAPPRGNNRPANVRENINVHPNVNVHENVNVYHGSNRGGHIYDYHPHPYHPYGWGPRWHPLGFFLSSLAADAYFFSLGNQGYYYDDGVYYSPYNGGYAVVPAPLGAIVSSLPPGYETVMVGDDYYYYYGGVFYIDTGQGYQVVQGPIGAVVTQIPDGATEQQINGQDLLVYNNTYYQPISQNGQDAYQVVTGN